MIVVAGPRIDPASLPQADGLEVRRLRPRPVPPPRGVRPRGRPGRSHDRDGARPPRKRPFLYFPLRHHFEQNFHVAHRLERYRAGRRMDFETTSPAAIAEAIADEIGREVDYRDVETDGARRAAERLAEMIG